VVVFNTKIQTQLILYLSEFSIIFYTFLKFTAFELGGFCNLAGRPLELLKSFQIGPWLVGEEGRSIAGQISVREATGSGEGLAHEHQELKARLGVGLGGRGDGRRWGSHGGQSGGAEELVGEGLPGKEGGQAQV
jgi:hypothetical protein